jgi:hypothetical protein
VSGSIRTLADLFDSTDEVQNFEHCSMCVLAAGEPFIVENASRCQLLERSDIAG